VFGLRLGTGTRRVEAGQRREAGGGIDMMIEGNPEGTRALALSFHSIDVVGGHGVHGSGSGWVRGRVKT
jgi:hypothetical protein